MRDKVDIKERRLLEEVKLLENEINNLKKVNKEKEEQLNDLNRVKDELMVENEVLKKKNLELDDPKVSKNEENLKTFSSLADKLSNCEKIHSDVQNVW